MMGCTRKESTNKGQPIIGRSLTRNVRCSPRKIRMVVNLIRNKRADEALTILQFTQRPSAVPFVERALKAAIASARDVSGEPEKLFIGEAIVDDAPMMKRMRPASMGRAVRVRKRNSHIFLALTQK